jgi:hypothetical protein
MPRISSAHRDRHDLSRPAIQGDFDELAEATVAAIRLSERDNPDWAPLARICLRGNARRLE